MEKGQIVRSMHGHDANSFYVVVAVEGTDCYLADGRRRKLEKPKRKNPKHLQTTNQTASEAEYASNLQIRRRLWALNFGCEQEGEQSGGQQLGKR